MESIKVGNSPRIVTSRKRIRYRQSAWSVHEFEVWSGELVSRAALVRAGGAELVWVGSAGEAALGEVALGVPGEGRGAPCEGRGAPGEGRGAPGEALSTALLGDGAASTGLARRLAAALARPVYVCCGSVFDRFSAPLLECGLVAEIKSRPVSASAQ